MDRRTEDELFEHRFEPESRAEIARRYDYLVQQLARKFRGRGADLDDLIQEARFGLLNAIDRFDTQRGVRFSTYAGRTIIGEIKHHFRQDAWSLRVPRSLQNLWLRASDGVQVLSQQLGRNPTIAELAKHLDVDAEEVLEALDAGGGLQPASLDKPVGDGESPPMVEMIGQPDRALARAGEWAELESVASSLDERERTILFMRFFEGKTQQEIADQIGVSQVHVSRLLRQTLDHVRAEIASTSA